MAEEVLGRGLSSLIPKKDGENSNEKRSQSSDRKSDTPVEASPPQKREEVAVKENGSSKGTDFAAQKTEIEDDPKERETVSDDSSSQEPQSEDSDEAPRESDRVLQIPIEKISRNDHQPRKDFDEERLQELADSIKEHGIIQPLVVSTTRDGYQLIAGERRLLAAKKVGLERVPAVLRDAGSEKRALLALVENVQRDNLNPIEEAHAYAKLEDEFFLSQDEVAKKVGKSRSMVANTRRLLNLPLEVQRGLKEGKISVGHGRTILSLKSPEQQRALYRKIVASNLSVRQAEAKIKSVKVKTHTRKVQIDPQVTEMIRQIETSLGTKVSIKKSKRGGFIEIAFFSDEELENLAGKLALE